VFVHLGEALSIVAYVWLSSATWFNCQYVPRGCNFELYASSPPKALSLHTHACCPPELAYGPRFEARIIRLVTLFLKVKPTLSLPSSAQQTAPAGEKHYSAPLRGLFQFWHG